MKKTLTLSTLFIVMASYGGSLLLANAQSVTSSATSTAMVSTSTATSTSMMMVATTTMTSTAAAMMTPTATVMATVAQTTTLQQQLDAAKAQLVKLQMEQGLVPQGDTGLSTGAAATVTSQPSIVTQTGSSMNLTASDVAAMNTALTSLTAVLTSLQTQIAQNPQFITTNGAGVIAALKGIGNTLAAIVTEAQGGNLAMATPQGTSVPTGSNGSIGTSASATQSPAEAPAVVTTPVATTPAITTPAATAMSSDTPAASGFSFASLNWPLIIVIILIIAAIAIWLWWDDGEDEKRATPGRNTSPQPQRPIQSMSTPSTHQSVNVNNQAAQPAATPMSSAVAAPMDQKRKTA